MAIDINDPRARQMLLAGMPQQPMMQQPIAPQMAQPQAQGPDSIAQFTKLLGGDLSGSLTSGDKLLALAALMRSATRSGRRAGLTPQQVMGQLQQQKVAELQNRLTVEQLRAAEAQTRQQIADTVEYANTLPESKRKAFLSLPVEKRVERMETEEFRQRQWVGTFTDANGVTMNRFLDGSYEPAGYDLPPDIEIDTYDSNGDGVAERVVLNKITREIIETRPLGETPNQIAAGLRADRGLDIRERIANRPPSGGGGGKRNAPAEIYDVSGNRVLAEFDPGSRQYYVPGTMTVIKRGVTPVTGLKRLTNAGGGRGPLLDPGRR